jgi:lambda family phage tail tape measure protein
LPANTPHTSKANPLSGLQSLVNSTGVSSLVIPNDKPTTEYVQTVAKLTEAFDKARAKGADLGAAEDLFAKGVAAANLKLKEQQGQIQQGNDRAFAQFKATLDQQVAAQKNAIDIQVASVGMGQKEAEQMRQLNALDQQRIEQVQRLEHAQATHPEQYAELQRQIDATNASFGDMRDTMVDGFHRMDAAQANWRNGVVSAMQDFIDAGRDVAGQMQNVVGGAFDSMADAIGNFVTTGKLDVKSLVASILSDFAKMEARIAASKLLSAFLSYFTGVSDNGSASFAPNDGSGAAIGTGYVGNALGGAYNSPSLAQYEGGVYNTPHFFGFANGGVFGEAGPSAYEAIMPLTRGADGKLGVRADGTGGMSVIVNQSYQISNSGASGSDQSHGEQSDAIRQFQKRMKDTAKQTILDEQRPGGSLWRMAHA